MADPAQRRLAAATARDKILPSTLIEEMLGRFLQSKAGARILAWHRRGLSSWHVQFAARRGDKRARRDRNNFAIIGT